MAQKGYRDTGICTQYIESHPVKEDGTEMLAEKEST